MVTPLVSEKDQNFILSGLNAIPTLFCQHRIFPVTVLEPLHRMQIFMDIILPNSFIEPRAAIVLIIQRAV